MVTLLSLQHLKITHSWNPSDSTEDFELHSQSWSTRHPLNQSPNIFAITKTRNDTVITKANTTPMRDLFQRRY